MQPTTVAIFSLDTHRVINVQHVVITVPCDTSGVHWGEGSHWAKGSCDMLGRMKLNHVMWCCVKHRSVQWNGMATRNHNNGGTEWQQETTIQRSVQWNGMATKSHNNGGTEWWQETTLMCVCHLVHLCPHRVVHSRQTAQKGRSLRDPLATIATMVQTDWLSARERNLTHNIKKLKNKTCLCWKKPEEHVTVKRFIDSEKSCNENHFKVMTLPVPSPGPKRLNLVGQ